MRSRSHRELQELVPPDIAAKTLSTELLPTLVAGNQHGVRLHVR